MRSTAAPLVLVVLFSLGGTSLAGLVLHANGALVPEDTAEVASARSLHAQAHAVAAQQKNLAAEQELVDERDLVDVQELLDEEEARQLGFGLGFGLGGLGLGIRGGIGFGGGLGFRGGFGGRRGFGFRGGFRG